MDDFLVCSDFCEEQGYPRQAGLLRALGGAGGVAYIVMERGAEYNDEIMSPNPAGEPGVLFLDRDEAERVAAGRNAEWHRRNNILDFCYSLKEASGYSKSELEARITEILGRPYRLPNDGEPTWAGSETPLIEGDATPEQMRQIAGLFTLEFFYVEEVRFAGPRDDPFPTVGPSGPEESP